MITVHPANADDFSTLGYGALQAETAPVEELAGGMYQMTLTHPMGSDSRWRNLREFNIIKAPAPMREVPSFVIQEETPGETVAQQIYAVDTPSGKRLHLRASGSLSAKIITMYKPGTEVVRLSVSGDWARVVVCKGGATGYMWADYLRYVRTETETVPGTGAPGKVIQPRQTREQLFRITRPEKDDAAGKITVKALHISYDLSGNAIRGALEVTNTPADEAVRRILAQANDEHPFNVYCASKKLVTADWTGKSVAAALWGDGGVTQLIGGELIRDNFDIFILDDAQRDRGMEVRHGKNMLGTVAYSDVNGVLTRIIPVGKNKDGSRLMLDGTPYVESPRAAGIPVIRSKEVEYDVQVGQDGIETVAAARAKLRELAEADFAAGADGTLVGLDVDFAALENTVEYAQYAGLQTTHLYDIVHVISTQSDIRADVRMTGYVFEAAGRNPHYTAVTLGDITGMDTTLYGYDLADGTTPGTKLVNNSVSGVKLRDASVDYAKITVAAIEQLVANSITAVRAHINELVAGSVTTDQLYADLATLAAAQITAAKIQEADIDWASITTLQATIATIAKAQITAANIEEANIQWAEIESLAAKMAEIAQAKIDDAKIDAAQIKDLEAEVAKIVKADIGSADIGFAQIKDLTAGTAIIEQGVGGELYIARLAVTEANMVSLSVGELVVKGADGHFYALGIDEGGNVTTTLKQVANDDVKDLSINAGEKIIEGTVTAACLNVNDIFANNAIIRQLIAANIDVATLFAREATIAQLNAMDITGNKYLKLTVEGIEVDLADLDVRTAENESSIRLLEDEIALKVSESEYYGVKKAEGALVQADGLLDGQGIHVKSRFGPVQSGSGNPYPAGGGKNLLENTAVGTTTNGVTFTVNADGSVTANGTSQARAQLIVNPACILPAGTYVFSQGFAANVNKTGVMFARYQNSGGEWIYIDLSYYSEVEFTLTERASLQVIAEARIAGIVFSGFTFYPMIRAASGSGGAAYQGDSFSVQFGQTVYGGTLDWSKGVLTADRALITLTGDETWVNYGTGLPMIYPPAKPENDGAVTCSHLVNVNDYAALFATPNSIRAAQDGIVMHWKDIVETGDYLTAIQAEVRAQYEAGTPVQVCYSLAEPEEIPLEPVWIDALAGLNTVYTDLDSNDVEFGHESREGLGAASERDLTALASRVTTAEQKITADAIVSTVTSSATYKALETTAGTAKTTADTAKANAAKAQSAADAAGSTANGNKTDIAALTTRVSAAESKIEQKADSITLSVLRTEVEGLAEEVKEPAKALKTGTTVTITDEEFDVQTKQASFSIIDDSSGEAQERLRIDEEGLTAQEATFGVVHSDSVVLTQAAASYTPANAGEMQALLDNLSNRFLLGDVNINAAAVNGGAFRASGVHGNGMLTISGGVLNSLELTHCSVMTAVYNASFSASGAAVSAVMSRVYLRGCALNAAKGIFLDRGASAVLRDCTGTCTVLADVTFSSVLRIMGDSLPYGVLGEISGEVYSPLAFTAAPSAPGVTAVTEASLPATATRTWNGGWLSGNVLYQGKTASDGSLRRGCMWFDRTAIAGKTIVSATLTLKRVDGIGGGGAVEVGIYGTTAASASGTPAVGTKYASVSLANGATKSVDVTAAVQALANGSIAGLMIYDTRTGTFSSKTYTYGYCKLYGSSDSARPMLKVVYK